MQYLFAIEKRQFAKPKINIEYIKDDAKPFLLLFFFYLLHCVTLSSLYLQWKYQIFTHDNEVVLLYLSKNQRDKVYISKTNVLGRNWIFSHRNSFWGFRSGIYFISWKHICSLHWRKKCTWTKKESTRFGCSTDVLKILSDNYAFCAASCFST